MREIEFSKTIKATGTFDQYGLDLLNPNENRILLFSIQFGNINGLNFAILTDEMNGYVYDYGPKILAKLEHQSLQEIVNKGGAIAIIASDINMEGRLLLTTDFEINSESDNACTTTIDLRLNNVTMKEQFNCTNDRLIIPPISRKKRDISEDSSSEQHRDTSEDFLSEQRDYNHRYPECENTQDIFHDDFWLSYEQIMEKTEKQRQCCKGDGQRLKRQIVKDNRKMSILWPMPIYYEFMTYEEEEWIKIIKKGINLISQLTCVKFKQIPNICKLT
ncbi:hypothetical protein Mgra_00002842 [Meloidogyne graminicola]|uniref:Uncharacterized protein n=1 Tax=Meloidogyne graminicola TaxID=189291 RepID=A0A8S9ZWR1_9BILA|nr:hypothetical protein Mgra_00002842 [Meloidogyne graminicola]